MIAKKYLKYACLFILWTSISIHALGQEIRIDTVVYSSIDVEMLGIEDGLSQGMINDVVEDQDGYLWIATKEGLNRYDGSSIKVYRHDPENPASIAENHVGRLHVDQFNRLWVATQTRGLSLYSPEKDEYIHFGHQPDEPQSISTNYPHRMMSSPDGELLVWARDKNELGVTSLSETAVNSAVGVSFQSVCDYYPGFNSHGKCWIEQNFFPNKNSKDASGFTTDGSFWTYNGSDSVYCFQPEALWGTKKPTAHSVKNDMVEQHLNVLRCLFFNQERTHAFITDGHRSIWRIDPVSQQRELFVRMPREITISGPVLISSSNDIWIHSANDTICRIDPDKSRLEVFAMKGEWVAGNLAAPMIEDQFGNIWLPTGGYGLAKINARKKRFIHMVKPASYGLVYPTWPYRMEAPGKSKSFGGDAWIEFTGKCTKEIKSVFNRHSTLLNRSLTMDANNHIWCTLNNRSTAPESYQTTQLIELDRDLTEKRIHIDYRASSELWHHHFVPIFFDSAGRIWFGMGNDEGEAELEMYEPKSQNRRLYKFPITTDPLQYRFISDWWEDESHCWWLATVKGLFWLNPKTSEWRHFSMNYPSEKALSMDLTLSLCPDPENPDEFIWVGTEGAGLNKLNRKTGQCEVFDVEDGLPNNVIYGIQSDHNGNLWLSTNRGLCLFDPRTGSTRNFTEKDGLNGNEFNRYEYSKSDDGTLYFGGVKGTTSFHPEEFYHDTLNSIAVINGLRILNKPVNYSELQRGESDFQLETPIEQTKALTFPHDIGMITLTYSLLDFTVPDQYIYKYKLEGQDEEWIEAGNARDATYTSLRPGDYTFRVMGLNSHNQWSEEATMAITILPPWWATWWFRTLVAMTFVGLLYALYRYRLAQVLHVERVRNRIAQDLHDEIGSTLSSISLYSAVVQNSTSGLPEKSKAVLDKISSSTSEMMESMNDIVWTIKADNDSFLNVVNRMRAFAVHMTESRGIQLSFDVKGEAEQLKLDMEQRKNIYLVFKEAINNAVKYAKAQKITVAISFDKRSLELWVRDDGKGFDLKEVMSNRELLGGNGLRGMKSRAKEIGAELVLNTESGKGTELGLVVNVKNHWNQ